jgi:subtilisin family serine protease
MNPRARTILLMVAAFLAVAILSSRNNTEQAASSFASTPVPAVKQPIPQVLESKLNPTRETATKRAELPTVPISILDSENLEDFAAPLRHVKTTSKKDFVNFPFYETNGARVYFNPGVVLLKKSGSKEVLALRTEQGSEQPAVAKLQARSDVEFAELDTIQTRQFTPSDANLNYQWHHQVIDSFGAWEKGLGNHNVTVAIVDTPFQMNHPDLIDNVDFGWDVTDQMPILTASGDDHATMSAGMTAATINNGLGVAGAANCRIIPIGINGATSEMYQAVIWAADHGVRVVNISWTGGGDDVLETAGQYLEEHAQGVLVMPGLNGAGRLNITNQPHIICVSMTDLADNLRSVSGPHIDFAAPGWDIYSTTTNSSYTTASGTSFASPLFSGVVAMVMTINPALTATQVIEALKNSADDKGNPGWDESYGWGRVNYRAAVNEAVKSLPVLSLKTRSDGIEIAVQAAFPASLTLERCGVLNSDWAPLAHFNSTNNLTIFSDQLGLSSAFYRVRAEAVR